MVGTWWIVMLEIQETSQITAFVEMVNFELVREEPDKS